MPSITLLPSDIRTKLLGILGRLASDFGGERAAAGLLATRMLQNLNLGWDDLLREPIELPPQRGPDNWRFDALAALRQCQTLSPWEMAFLANVLKNPAPPSDKQRLVLCRLLVKATTT